MLDLIVRFLRPDRRVLVGAVAGAAASLVGAGSAMIDDPGEPVTVVPALTVVAVGLVLGTRAAAWCYVAGVVTLVVLTLTPAGAAEPELTPLLRFGTFIIGSPLVLILLWRAERQRDAAHEARDMAEAAHREVEAERRELRRARGELHAALASAERERARLEEVAEAIPEPLIVYDDEGVGTYANRAAMRTFGRSFVERPLGDWGRAVEPRDEHGRPLEPDEWPQVAAQRDLYRRRMTLRVPTSGRDVVVDVEGMPIRGVGAVLLLRDVEREEEERRRLAGFASFVAHELRNPLAVAKARIELAQRDPTLPERAANHGARALESVDAAIGILERLELFSRADTGRIEAERAPFGLSAAVGSAIERLRVRGSERPVELRGADGLHVVGDRHLAEQAITNLLTNADRYSEPGEPIAVELTDGDPVTLRVIDAGPGVADDVADRLFHDRVVAGRGLGLGLYLVHATMEAMGGSVALEQRRPRAIFALRWPRGSAPPAADAGPGGDGASAG